MNYFAADVGGTAVKWAVVTPEYQVVKKGSFPMEFTDGDSLLSAIAGTAGQQKEAFAGAGISMPGTLFDDEDGVVHGGGHLRFMNQVPMGKSLRERLGIPVYVENDGKSCALGEYAVGALRGHRIGVVMVLGSGVGGGIVIDGNVYKGAHCFAGEMSFVQLRPGSTQDMTQRFGGSGGWKTGLLRNVLEEKGYPADTELDGNGIFELINGGDEAAIRGLRRYAADIAMQIWNLQAILDPEIFAIGGGISEQPALMAAIQEAIDEMVEQNSLKQFPVPVVMRCEHGNDANLLGAVYRCRQRMQEQNSNR